MTSYYNFRFFWYRNIGIGIWGLIVGFALAVAAYSAFANLNSTTLTTNQLLLLSGYSWAIIVVTYTTTRACLRVYDLTAQHLGGVLVIVVVCFVEMMVIHLNRDRFFGLYPVLAYTLLLFFYGIIVDMAKPPLAPYVVVELKDGGGFASMTRWEPHEAGGLFRYVQKKLRKKSGVIIRNPRLHKLSLEEAMLSLGCTFRVDRNGISVWEKGGESVASHY